MPNIPSQKQLNELEFDRNFEKQCSCKILKSNLLSPLNLKPLKPVRNYYGEERGFGIAIYGYTPIINKFILFRN